MVNYAFIEEIAQARHYKIDEGNKLIIYDSSDNHIGQRDNSIYDTIENMIYIAKREKNYEIQSNFNGGIFTINKNTTLEQGVEIARKAMREYEEKQKPLLAQQEQNRQARIQKQNEIDTELIKDEALLSIDAPSFVKQYEKGVRFAEHWGKLMQAEMKKQKSDKLTEDIVNRTERRTSNYLKNHDIEYFNAREILIATWVYGKELGKILEIPQERILNLRKQATLSNIQNKIQPPSNAAETNTLTEKEKPTKETVNSPSWLVKLKKLIHQNS